MIVTVIGLGTFGSKTATRLFEKGAEVIAIDQENELVDIIPEKIRIKKNICHKYSCSKCKKR